MSRFPPETFTRAVVDQSNGIGELVIGDGIGIIPFGKEFLKETV
ncbi:hypothetical protein FHS16_006000 [Paenibacillus endophyticus]|uniref:Uncharacterized protein n=1 Tax=Paenibacillus endophyticus TaxID=1294268 RepID=A0A7W5CFD3_9BACL|nr:hypothetical protein [Paenibacillus endophyticus]